MKKRKSLSSPKRKLSEIKVRCGGEEMRGIPYKISLLKHYDLATRCCSTGDDEQDVKVLSYQKHTYCYENSL